MKKVILLVCLCMVLAGSMLTLPAYSQENSFPNYQLLPADESNRIHDFKTFRDKLTAKVKSKDISFLLNHVDENVMFSFGFPGAGKKEFIDEWQLASTPDHSGIWHELGEVLRLGCVYNPEEKSFIAPYVFTRFPDSFDPYEYEAIIAKNVPVFAKPDLKSKVLGKLDYSIVKVDLNQPIKQGNLSWLKIETAYGLKGYINAINSRSPIDYRAEFKKINGIWKITYFIAGD